MRTNGEAVTTQRSKAFPLIRLLLLVPVCVLIQGYHLGVEDGEIYIPTAKKLFDPGLYPYGDEFFLSHGHLSLFGPILAWTSRLTHLPIDWSIFSWYIVTVFAMLASSWMLLSACFESARARWTAMLVLTGAVAMPATNTGLLLMDPYMTARSFSTPLTMFTLAFLLERKYVAAAVAMLATACFHPQMVAYLIFLAFVIWVAERSRTGAREPVPVMAAAVGILPTGFALTPATDPYREALYSRDYFFLYNWAWYHWIGLLAPLAILAWFWKRPVRGTRPAFSRLSFALLPFGLLSLAAAIFLSFSPSLDMFARLQPLRTFHLITLVIVLLVSGVFGEYVAKDRLWITAVLASSLAVGMFFVQRTTYPHSPHIELPSERSANPWVNTLLWVRNNTPKDAVFAVDSRYFLDPEADVHGFRSIAARSALADYYKDGGVVSLFPSLAVEWKAMTNATYGLNHFTSADFRRLKTKYSEVSWTVVHGQAPAGLACPYQQNGYAVCQLP